MMINNLEALKLFTRHEGGDSTVNDRNSAGRHLGTRRADGQKINTGSIVFHQHGTRIHPGKNVGVGGDDTLFALTSGVIKFRRLDRDRKQVFVYPVEGAK